MTYFHPAWLEHQRKRYPRADAYRFAAPGTPEAKPPGWLDPSMTRVRLKEAQEAEARAAEAAAQATFEAQLAALRASHERAKEELAEINYDLVLRRLIRKFRPDQQRVPAGSPPGGQWTSGASATGDATVADSDGGDANSDTGDAGDAAQSDTSSDANTLPFSPDRSGWHDYGAGPNLVCRAELKCSREEIADNLARFSVPGRDPSNPVKDSDISLVLDPRTGVPGGWIITKIEDDGLTVINRTTILHALYDGKVVRTATQDENGAWHVTTRGFGNNVLPGMNLLNREEGPPIFNILDQRMRDNIERHHAKGVLALSLHGLDGGRDYGRTGALAGAHHV